MAREYGGLLANRSFGGAQVSRTFYARGQTGQQLLLGAYSALSKEIARGGVQMFPRTEMLDLVLVDGHAKGIVVRDLVTGKISSHAGDAVLLCTGGYGNVFYLSTNAKGCNVTATWRAHKKGALFANPCYTQIHPTCIPVSGDYQSKLTLMSESLRNDGRVWVPKKKEDCGKPAAQIPEDDARLLSRAQVSQLRQPRPARHLQPLPPRKPATKAAASARAGSASISTSPMPSCATDATRRRQILPETELRKLGKAVIAERYGNLFDMYEQITGENGYEQPMRIYPAVHYTMGGLWVDYNLMSNVPGLHVLGEANFSDHGANRLGASALMQGLADGYFVIPTTIANYLATQKPGGRHDGSRGVQGSRGRDQRAHQAIPRHQRQAHGGQLPPRTRAADVGRVRHGPQPRGTCRRRSHRIPALREEFWNNVMSRAPARDFNQELEKAGRVADFLEFGELICLDALQREESCGGHFRVEYQYTKEDEAAKRGRPARRSATTRTSAYVAAWEYTGDTPSRSCTRSR